MVTAKPFSVTNLQDMGDGSYRFTVVIHTSLGLWYSRGFRIHSDGRLFMPSVRYGLKFYPLVKLTPHQHAAIKKLALRAIARMKRHGDEGGQAPANGEVPGQEPVLVQPESGRVPD